MALKDKTGRRYENIASKGYIWGRSLLKSRGKQNRVLCTGSSVIGWLAPEAERMGRQASRQAGDVPGFSPQSQTL